MRVHKVKANTIGEFFIPKVIARSSCSTHKAAEGTPCWQVEIGNGSILPAVCSNRTYRAGFVGGVSPHSLQLRRRNDGN